MSPIDLRFLCDPLRGSRGDSWGITLDHVEDVALGAVVPGTGVVNEPDVPTLMVREALRTHGPSLRCALPG
jgi:hypothetical protein